MAERSSVVVIGAGLGGLSAAVRLAHAGVPVTVLERASAPGGKLRTADSAAGPVDAGPTVLTMRRVFETLFADVGESLADHLTLTAEPILARHWWPDGSTLDLFADAQASAAAVRGFAGARAETEFHSFAQAAKRLFDAFDAPMMQSAQPRRSAVIARVLRDPRLIGAMAPHRTLAQSLAARFGDARLRQLFGRYATYVGGSPFAAPAILALIWHSEAQGVWRVQGGMHRLASVLARLCGARGAVLRYGADVARIETVAGRVAAVVLRDGERIAASRVLFNGDPAALSAGLLGPAVATAVAARTTAPRSHSAWVWAFAARAAGRDLAHHSVFFGADPATEFAQIAKGSIPQDPTLYVCAQDRGSGAPPPGLAPERFEVIMNAAPASRVTGSGEECRTRVFQTLARHGLTFDPPPGQAELTGPAQFAAMFPGSDGSLYGRSPQGLMAAFQRPTARTRVAGLYLAGGGVHPGAGMPMATLSGGHAAAAILTDLALPSPSRRTATPGGMSTASATAAAARSASSGS